MERVERSENIYHFKELCQHAPESNTMSVACQYEGGARGRENACVTVLLRVPPYKMEAHLKAES